MRTLMDWFKGGAAVLTAVIVVIGGLAAIALFMYEGTIEPEVGMPIFAGALAAGYGFLWAKATQDAAQRAYRDGLMTPVPPEDPRPDEAEDPPA